MSGGLTTNLNWNHGVSGNVLRLGRTVWTPRRAVLRLVAWQSTTVLADTSLDVEVAVVCFEAVIEPPASCLLPAQFSSLAISDCVLASRDTRCYCQVRDKTRMYRGLGALNRRLGQSLPRRR